jgi:hypothetical protein
MGKGFFLLFKELANAGKKRGKQTCLGNPDCNVDLLHRFGDGVSSIATHNSDPLWFSELEASFVLWYT